MDLKQFFTFFANHLVYNLNLYVTRHEKAMLIYTKYTSLHYFNYLTFCVSYTRSVNCIASQLLAVLLGKISLIHYA